MASSDGRAADQSEVMDSMASLTSGSDSVLGAMLLSGDNSQAAQLISTVAGVLNTLTVDTSDNGTTSGNNTSTTQVDAQEARKEVSILRECSFFNKRGSR